MTVINTNVGALMARTYAARANTKMTSSMERLSSGHRINSAADDAAGLAVANKMESQHRGIKMAMRNSQDGISLVQTAESAMQEVSNMILRMRELAVQMDNGVYTAKDRDNAQLEINALIAEIDKIAANTRFNDVALLDGTYDQNIRSGNTNAEVTRIKLDSLFSADNGKGSSITSKETSFGPRPVATTPADFTIEAADLLETRLGIRATSFSSLDASDSEAVLSNIVSDADYRDHGGNTLLLKDNVADLGYSYATVTLTDLQWERVADNLDLTKRLYNEIASLDPTNAQQYGAKVAQIGKNLAELEVERSHYIGSLFHSNEIALQGVHVAGGLTGNKYAEIVNVYSDPDTKQSIAGQIAAVEIDFQELTKELHDPRSCAHCIAKANAGAVGAAGVGGSTGVGGGFGFTDGVDANGDRYAAIATTHTGTGSGWASATSPTGGLSSIIGGSKWNNVGNDGNGTSLSYSYWDGASPHDYTEGGTKTTLDSHSTGSNNTTAHDLVFDEWDAVSSFALDKVTEDGDGNPVGDIRVHVLDTMPSGAAAYAYYPSSSAKGGDVYYGSSMMGNATDTDFVTEGYNWYTALHEIGHALGLSHPFDGGAKDGSTLNLNLDGQRNTVMTYVQTDRNVRIAKSGSSLSWDKVNISTPGLLDIEAMEHLYGSTGWSHNNSGTTYGGGAGIDAFDNNYDSIRVIADSGGADTIDASGVTATGNIINLTPGTYSSINYYATDAEKIAAVAAGSTSAVEWFTGQIANLDASASAANDHYSGYTRTALYRGQDNVGIAHNTWIENAIGGSGIDTITGNSMGNEIRGNGGNDIIDGGDGDDIVYVTGNYAQSRLTGTAANFTITDGAGGTDTVTNVEYIRFDDGVWTSGNAISGGAAANASHAWRTPITASTTKTGGQTGGVTNGDSAANVGGMALKDVKIETQADAQNAVTVLNRSLEQIATGRAKLGAVSNRLTHNLDNQTQASMMAQQARGRVVDTDMAVESTKLAQEQILSQAAQQAINMATQRQQTVLMLLDT